MSCVGRLCLLALVLALAVHTPEARPAWPPAAASWPGQAPPGGGAAHGAWERTLAFLWEHSRDSIGFCVGSSQWKVQRLAGLSFPWSLPVEAGAAGVCGNRTSIDAHLCTPP